MNLVKIGKRISYLLRHEPEDLDMDEHGWVSIDDLIKKLKINIDVLDEIVETNNKKRYTYNDDKTKIRANQGHSLKDVYIEMETTVPPKYLYHGTSMKNESSINEKGLLKMNRQHVHLSKDIKTAINVGKRHTNGGKVLLIRVETEKMYDNGYKFFRSKNGVWLTDNVPPMYIRMKM